MTIHPLVTNDDNPKALAATRDQKPPLHLLERAANEEIAKALETGAAKYGERNYQTIPIKANVYGGAIRRHIDAWLDGEDYDPDSGLSHIAHIGANVQILLTVFKKGNFEDDRGPQPRSESQELLSARANQTRAQTSIGGSMSVHHE